MTRKQIVILVAVGLFVVLGIVFGFVFKPTREVITPGGTTGGNASVSLEELGLEPGDVFTSEVPRNAKPTVPTEQSVAAPGAEEKFGIFDMTVSSAGFNPENITVNLGDVVQIKLTAQGGDYDFAVPWSGLYTEVKERETKQITFGATSAGTFVFMCRDFCPTGKTITGSIIVLP